MKLVEYNSVGRVRILLMDCDQKKYDVQPFLNEIKVSRPNDYYQLLALLDRTAEYGVIANAQKTKPLHGNHAKPLWEFCAKGGSRIFWFFDEGNKSVIVCAHGFVAKGRHDHTGDIDRAQKRRKLYYEQR